MIHVISPVEYQCYGSVLTQMAAPWGKPLHRHRNSVAKNRSVCSHPSHVYSYNTIHIPPGMFVWIELASKHPSTFVVSPWVPWISSHYYDVPFIMTSGNTSRHAHSKPTWVLYTLLYKLLWCCTSDVLLILIMQPGLTLERSLLCVSDRVPCSRCLQNLSEL